MKQFILSMVLICIVVVSCKKEHTTTSSGTLHKVSFTVGFSAHYAVSNTNNLKVNSLVTDAADTALTNHIQVLIFGVYASNGTFVHQVVQKSTDADFGSYTDNLAAGAYTVVVAGGNTGLVITSNKGATPTGLSTDILSYGYYGNNFKEFPVKADAFFKKISITVDNSDVTQSVALIRITSEIKIIIKDAIPASVKTLQANIYGPQEYFNIGTETAGQIEPNINVDSIITTANVGKTNYTITQLVLPSATQFKVILYAYDATNGYVAQKIIPPFTCTPNVETILTGNLFGGAGGNSVGNFPLTVDTAWNSTQITKSFP